ncbi:MAG: class I SAM-dependent methyltransferase [Bdellovibrionota bacterium]|nr:MAG: class I SAM-dependent methyltransferase [Bdellovibrionota bacterium]
MCTNCNLSTNFDAARSDAFGGMLLDTMNKGALALMLSIGHRSGLFDVMAGLPPSSSLEIAAAAQLQERYVREWLGAMVTGRVVDYDPATKRYHLPAEHAGFLTRAAGANNIATLTQYIGELGSVESRIVECFKKGGGVAYSEFPRFHEVMADDSGQSVLPALFEHILPLAPQIEATLTAGGSALDVGCGRAKALMLMAERFPRSTFTGYEISPEVIEWANAEAARRGLDNIRVLHQDAATIKDDRRFDVIFTFDAIHDQADPAKVLKNIQRALKDDGVYLMQDIDTHSEVGENLAHPIGTLIYTISCMHCMTVSLAQGGAGLGAAWGVEKAQQMLNEAGFRSTAIHRLSHDIQNAYFVNKK